MDRTVTRQIVCLTLGATLLLGLAERAEAVLYWKGDLPGGITNAANYCTDAKLKNRCTQLPVGDEIWIRLDNTTIAIDEGMRDQLSIIGSINTRDADNFALIVTNELDLTLPFAVSDRSGYGSYKTSHIVKYGAGMLKMGAKLPEDVGKVDGWTRCGFDVREGSVRFYDLQKGNSSLLACDVKLAADTTFYCPTNPSGDSVTMYIGRLSGAGTLTLDNNYGKHHELTIGGVWTETEPAIFSGQVSGAWYIVNLDGYTYYTGENDYTAALRGCSDSWQYGAAVGFMTWPADGTASSLGKTTEFDNRAGPIRLRYLGTEPITAGGKITVWDTRIGPTTIDGGLYGGLTWKGSFAIRDHVSIEPQQRVAFSGSNTLNECVFTSDFGTHTLNGTNYSFHVTKDGSGTWRFSDVARGWLGALTVRDGALKFGTIAEAGVACSLGKATALYDDVSAFPPDLPAVSWAWRLGAADDNAATGTLHYVGTEKRLLESRATALAGQGRFRFDEGSVFKYKAGITTLGTGEKSIAFDSGAGATNIFSGISQGEGCVVSVRKEGAGHTMLTGDLGFSGDLAVDAGELVLKDLHNAEFRYYRINFKENISTSTHPGLEDFRGTAYSGIQAGGFGLYDSDSKRVADGSLNDTNVTFAALGPNEGIFADEDDITIATNTHQGRCGIRWMFNQSLSSGAHFQSTWKDARLPTPDDPSTWYRVYVHLKDSAKAPIKWDLCYYGRTNEAEFAENVTALSIDASADGLNWEEVAATNNIVRLYGYDENRRGSWLSNPDPEAWNLAKKFYLNPDRQSHPLLPLVSTNHQVVYTRPTPRSVRVNRGATLKNESATALSVSKISLDVGGMGTLSGFACAEGGTIDCVNVDETQKRVEISADFTQFGDCANLADWQVTVNGRANDRFAVKVSESGIVLEKRGLTLLVR